MMDINELKTLIKDIIIECYIDKICLIDYIQEELDYIDENIFDQEYIEESLKDNASSVISARKQYKQSMRKAKKLLKEAKYTEAIKELNSSKKSLKDIEKEITRESDNNIINVLINTFIMIIPITLNVVITISMLKLTYKVSDKILDYGLKKRYGKDISYQREREKFDQSILYFTDPSTILKFDNKDRDYSKYLHKTLNFLGALIEGGAIAPKCINILIDIVNKLIYIKNNKADSSGCKYIIDKYINNIDFMINTIKITIGK